MTDAAARGRAHLEGLLGRAEKIVRVSPSDTLVLMGVSDASDPQEFAPIMQLLDEQGIEASGVLVLGQGLTLDSIDMNELHQAWMASRQAEEGTEIKVIGHSEVSPVPVSCPRCMDKIPVPVTVVIGDDGKRMHARSSVDQTDLAVHELVCPGEGTAEV